METRVSAGQDEAKQLQEVQNKKNGERNETRSKIQAISNQKKMRWLSLNMRMHVLVNMN